MKVQGGALDPRFNQIPCPVLRTLVKEDLITVGPEGQVDLDQLKRAFKGLGVNDLVSNILASGGHGASPVKPELLMNAGRKELDIYRLRGSSLDHAGDTRILRDPGKPYSQERLDALLSLSSDGKTLTLADLAAANKQNVRDENGGFRDAAFGLAELGALLLVFGKRRDDGVKALKLEDVATLFRDHKIPEGFTPGDVGVLDVVGAVAKMTYHRIFTVSGRSQAGLDLATDKPRALEQSSLDGLRLALCPAGMKSSPAVSQTEVASLHSQR